MKTMIAVSIFMIFLAVYNIQMVCSCHKDIKLYGGFGRKKRAKLISFDKTTKCIEGKKPVNYECFSLTVEYLREDGLAQTAAIETINRKALKYMNCEYVDIITIDDDYARFSSEKRDPIIEEDMATSSKELLHIFGAVIFMVLFFISLAVIIKLSFHRYS